MPCIIKPATGSGGSAMVFFAIDIAEALTYADYIRRTGGFPLAQEYISPDEGEFTVGVLSLPSGEVVGSIALRRSLDSKLSVLSRGRGGLVSSGYSQGYIGDFQSIRKRAEAIASAVGSCGALNIQGRVRDGEFIPFEINPRLSASTYLRAMAGFNEVDLLLQHLAFNKPIQFEPLREGWYLRSLTEQYVTPQDMKL
jgi:carbamoyl-phosphate synthase large subunit